MIVRVAEDDQSRDKLSDRSKRGRKISRGPVMKALRCAAAPPPWPSRAPHAPRQPRSRRRFVNPLHSALASGFQSPAKISRRNNWGSSIVGDDIQYPAKFGIAANSVTMYLLRNGNT
jgi:hypothetical protein